jgi:dihydroflavonol-4-reductase
MTRAFVTGANGHIGASIVKELEGRGYEVSGLVRPGSDRRGLEGSALTIHEGDVLDAPSVARAMKGADVVFHCAASFALWARDPDEILRPALEGTRNVLEAAASAGVRRVVHTSSAAAVGASTSADRLLMEDDWFDDPRVPYYQAKTQSERLAVRLARERGIDLVTVCPTMVLGAGDYRLTPSQRVLLDLVNGKGVTVDGGTNVVSAADVAVGHVLAAERGRPFERYILGGDNLSIVEIGGLLEALTGVRPKHLRLPRWAFKGIAAVMELGAGIRHRAPAMTRAAVDDVLGKYAWYDLTRARAELGFEAAPAMLVIAEAIQWYGQMGWLVPGVAAQFEERADNSPLAA